MNQLKRRLTYFTISNRKQCTHARKSFAVAKLSDGRDDLDSIEKSCKRALSRTQHAKLTAHMLLFTPVRLLQILFSSIKVQHTPTGKLLMTSSA